MKEYFILLFKALLVSIALTIGMMLPISCIILLPEITILNLALLLFSAIFGIVGACITSMYIIESL